MENAFFDLNQDIALIYDNDDKVILAIARMG
jgi:hypothetical protein